MSDDAPRIVTNSPIDRLIGMMLERTEASRQEGRELRSAISELRDVTTRMATVLDNIVPRLKSIEDRPLPEERLKDCEEAIADYRGLRQKIVDAHANGENWVKHRNKIIYALAAIGAAGVIGGAISLSNLQTLSAYGLVP